VIFRGANVRGTEKCYQEEEEEEEKDN